MSRYCSLSNLLGWSTVAILVVGYLAGCSVGRSDAGDLILGMKVAQIPETASEALHAAAGLLPGPWGALAGLAATIVTGVAGAYATSKARDKADAAYDEGHSRGLLLAAANAFQEKPAPIVTLVEPPAAVVPAPLVVVPPQA